MTAVETDTIGQIAARLREPVWMTEVRRQALARHQALPWPHPSDDIWRRTDVTLLDPTNGFSPAEPALLSSISLHTPALQRLLQPLGDEQLLVRANGSWVTDERPSEAVVEELAQAAQRTPEPIRQILTSDGLTPAEDKLVSLNTAFHHDDLCIQVPRETAVSRPIRLLHLLSVQPRQSVFPLTIITVGQGSVVTLIDEYVSLTGAEVEAPHVINGRIELVLEPNARVHYVRLQRWASTAREFLFQRATLSRGAQLTMANIYLGSALSKTHVATRFTGEQAAGRLYGFVFGHHAQHIDQHTLQDHQAPHTTSNLEVKAALQDASRMIYTGLIRIAPQATQTNAYQSNHNLMLSRDAQAETIPMLEILADDVQCKHGASVGPINDEELFYVMSRGIPRTPAERLIVMGFVESIVQQVPFEPLQERLRQEIEGNLH